MNVVFLIVFLLLLGVFFYVVTSVIPYFRVSVGMKITEYETPKTALLVVDVQKDLTERGRRGTVNTELTDPMVGVINRLIEKADASGMPVVYIRHEFNKGLLVRLITRGVLAKGSDGAAIDPRIIRVQDNEYVKHTMDSFTNKEMELFLIGNQVDHLWITGLDAKYCIDKTVTAALGRGYRVSVIEDGIATKSEQKRTEKVLQFLEFGAEVVKSDQLISEQI